MTKIAFFDLTDCEGCELQFLNLKEELLDFFQDFDVISWRLLQEDSLKKNYDLVFVTGSPMTPEEQRLIKAVRRNTRFLVALGSCAIMGGIPGTQVNETKRKKLVQYVYGPHYQPKATSAQPLKAYVKVDAEINGCPVDFQELKQFLTKIPSLLEKNPSPFPKGVCRFVPDYISKIEGHGQLKVNLKESEAEFEVSEGERLIEGLLLDKDFHQAPFITSRICGICPVSHNLASIKALESALNIQPNEVVIQLRRLLLYGQIIHSHLFHLFFLALPDFLNKKSGIEVAQACPAEFHLALNIKRVSEKILSVIGGQVIHPTLTTLGGFHRFPGQEQLNELLQELVNTIDEAEDLVRFFATLKYPAFERETEYLALESQNGYEFYEGEVVSTRGGRFAPENYQKEIKEEIRPYSTAKVGRRSPSGFFVGALARLNHHYNQLNPKAKALIEGVLKPPFINPFHNNLAQAVEILHLFEESLRLIDELMTTPKSLYHKAEELPSYSVSAAEGVGCLEAPRGTLYHYYRIDKNGKISDCDIITPTVQNLSNIEEDARLLLKKTKGEPKNKRIMLLEMLIRAYDPCITCAVH